MWRPAVGSGIAITGWVIIGLAAPGAVGGTSWVWPVAVFFGVLVVILGAMTRDMLAIDESMASPIQDDEPTEFQAAYDALCAEHAEQAEQARQSGDVR